MQVIYAFFFPLPFLFCVSILVVSDCEQCVVKEKKNGVPHKKKQEEESISSPLMIMLSNINMSMDGGPSYSLISSAIVATVGILRLQNITGLKEIWGLRA